MIGNGFDIAHGLPTKYTDFLEFVKVIQDILNKKNINLVDWGNIDCQIKEIIEEDIKNEKNNLFAQGKTWENLLDDNFWIEYFLQNDMHGKENWIDFESEISGVIQSIHHNMHEEGKNLSIYDDIMGVFSNEFLECYFG